MSTLRLVLLFLLAYVAAATAAGIRGKVSNYANGDALMGVEVGISSQNLKTTTDEHGMYSLTNVPTGRYVLSFTHPLFHSYTFELQFNTETELLQRDIELKPYEAGETTEEGQLEQPRYRLDEVTILTTRASADHPVTFTNLGQEQIKERDYGQDLPLLFTELPNLTAYSDGGNGIGYSYLRMRGFGQNRVAVEVNGTPLNDAGDGQVYWIDLPDFGQDLQDIQVQRGVGSSLYGDAAFGGTINVVTKTPGLLDRPRMRAEATYGAFDTRRGMIMFESGRIQNRYGITARLTRMSTDGYKDNSWAKLWSYYLSAARFTGAHTTRVIFYGGPEQTHLAYNGVSKDYLEGRITGDKERDRRFNSLTYPGEIDNFFQPHYEIHDEWKINNKLSADNSLYLFRGDGYYDQYRTGQTISDYYFNLGQVPGIDINVLRRRNIGETDWGWIPRLNILHGWGQTTVGGEMRFHDAHHDGKVIWSDWSPGGFGPDYSYYDYRIRKENYSAFVHNIFDVTKNLKAMVDLQLRSAAYRMDRDRLWGVSWSKQWIFAAPRVGLNYQFLAPDAETSTPAAGVYLNISDADREPASSDIYDPQDASKIPRNDPIQFEPRPGGYRYVGQGLVPEEMWNAELGTHWQWNRGQVGLNYYWMSVRKEIVPYGPLDSLGVPLVTNADRTLHQGIELTGAYELRSWLTFSGNLALTDHHFVRYQELDWNTSQPVSRDGNRLADDPPYVANLRAEFIYSGFSAALGVQSVGKQYIDNSEDNSSTVPAYTVLNLDLGYRFAGKAFSVNAIDLRLRVNNLLDREYVNFGYPDDDGTPVYMVAAPRAVYTTLGVDF